MDKEKRLNILILSSKLPYPIDDGGTLILFHLVKRLSIQHNITLLTLADTEQQRYVPNLEPYCKVITVFHKKHNTNFTRLKYLFSMLPYGVSLAKNNNFKQVLGELLEKNCFDVVYCHYMDMAMYVADRRSIIKVIHSVDCDSLIHFRRMKKERKLLIKMYFWWQWYRNLVFEKKVYKLFDAIFIVSKIDAKELKKNIPNTPIIVAPNGVDTNYYKNRMVLQKEKSIIFTGVMDYYPNISSALFIYKHVYPLVKDKINKIKFYIVGKNPVKTIKELSKADPDVIVTGYVKDVRDFLEKCSVFVCYMVEGSGIKNKILEAMAMGLPVVANSIAVSGINMQEGKDFLRADSLEGFAENIILLLGDPNFSRTISDNGRDFVVKHHDWDVTATILIKTINGLLSNEKIKCNF